MQALMWPEPSDLQFTDVAGETKQGSMAEHPWMRCGRRRISKGMGEEGLCLPPWAWWRGRQDNGGAAMAGVRWTACNGGGLSVAGSDGAAATIGSAHHPFDEM
ncbi:hypothetical protein ACP70R_021644 [Stipagrostis hirtigluma subsp. patula]